MAFATVVSIDLMRDVAAQDVGVRLTRQVDVIGVTAFAAKKRWVLLAQGRLADGKGGSGLGRVLNVHEWSPKSPE
jgi:hypothetical protein